MNILVNDFPKCGLHATRKACELLGVPWTIGGHYPHGAELPEHTHHVFIRRDPRNALISRLRMEGATVAPGTFIARFRRYDAGKSLVQAMAEYEPWLTAAPLPLRFEDLIASDGEMRRLAAYLGVPYLADAWRHLPGATITWSGQFSDYRTVWTDDVQRVWSAEGGDELLARWGY